MSGAVALVVVDGWEPSPVHDDNAIAAIAIEVMIFADLTCLFRFGARATVPCTCL